MVEAILGIMGSQHQLHLVLLSKWSLVLIDACSARSSCLLYLRVVKIVVLSLPLKQTDCYVI